MDIEKNDNGHSWKCWLTDDEYELMKELAPTLRHKVAIRLGGESSFRSMEIPQVTPDHIKEHDGVYYIRIPRGKDTTGNGGKPRDAILPQDVERDLLELRYKHDVDEDEPFFDVTPRRIQQIVKEVADLCYEESGDPDWQKVSSHDLRRFFATTCLVENRMNPRVVMKVGGWEDFQSIEPYLNQPSKNVTNEEFQRAGLL